MCRAQNVQKWTSVSISAIGSPMGKPPSIVNKQTTIIEIDGENLFDLTQISVLNRTLTRAQDMDVTT